MKIRVRLWDTVSEAVTAAASFAIHRSYKHRDDHLPDGVAESLIENFERETMNALSEIIDFESAEVSAKCGQARQN